MQYGLEADFAARLDEKPAAMPTAQHCERGGGRAEDRDAGQLRRGARECASGKIAGIGVAGAVRLVSRLEPINDASPRRMM